jgi:hypothetical protein
MVQSAYTAWLLGAGGEKYTTWSSFLEHFGLMEKAPQKKVDTQRLYKMADEYLDKMDRKGVVTYEESV